jgi:Tfp pilus assembly protein PilF
LTTVEENEVQIPELLTRARHCYRAGELDQVEALCRQILGKKPGQLKALYLLAMSQQERGKLNEASGNLDEILAALPQSPRAHHARGLARQEQGNLSEAVRSFQEAVALRPGLVPARIAMALGLEGQGKSEEAAALLREVLDQRPELAEVHLALGTLLEKLGKLEEAVHAYRQAVRLDPDRAAAHNNLGALLLKQGELAEAGRSIGEALRLQPSFAEAHYNLGTLWHRRRQLTRAIDSYQRALRFQPAFVAAHNGLATVLIEDGQQEAAREHLEESLRLQPQQAEAHATRGKLLLQEGQRDQAVASFQEALRQDPDCVPALAVVAYYHVFPLDDADRERMRALVASPYTSLAEASRLHFGLATQSDRAGAYDDAFAHYRQGNLQRRKLLKEAELAFDAPAHHRWVERIRTVCDTFYFRRSAGKGRSTERPVFIVGMPRSGTSLVEQILSSHPDIYGAGELRNIDQIARELPARLPPPAPGAGASQTSDFPYPDCILRLGDVLLCRLADEYLEWLARLNGPALRVTDKMPVNFLHLGLIAALFPRARVIHCVRDARDVCLSCYQQDFAGVNFSCDLGDLGHFYRDYRALMEHWRSVLPLSMFDVVYEELVADQEVQSRRLVEFCGLAWDDRCLRHDKNPRAVHTASQVQVRQPIYKSSVGRWKNYARHLGPLFEVLGETPEGSP